MKKCKKCLKEYEDNISICPDCLEPLVRQVKVCKSCNSLLSDNSIVCDKCKAYNKYKVMDNNKYILKDVTFRNKTELILKILFFGVLSLASFLGFFTIHCLEGLILGLLFLGLVIYLLIGLK